MAVLHGKKFRTHLTFTPEEHARFLACLDAERARMKRPRPITLSGWFSDLGNDRADELGVPAVVHETAPPVPRAKRATKKKSAKR